MKLIATLFFSLFALLTFAQKNTSLEKPKVDERIEILSIVFRLADSEEYRSERFKLYSDKIQGFYSPFKNHELIQFIKNLRQKNGVGYDAVMSMAVYLDNDLNPIVKFTDEIPDKRWGKDNAYEFTKLLKQFYKDSNSKQFFESNQQLYAEASKRFLPVYEHLDLNWYTKFYGKEPDEKFVIINGLGNGGGNYGPSITLPSGKREVYAIMGTWKTDSLGMADFTINNYFPTLLHEFNHSFINHLLDKNPKPFKNSGEKIFKTLAKEMQSQAYATWETMLNEALVRAAVIKYMKDHKFNEQEIEEETNEQLNRGFVWIEELVAELEKYDHQRNQYPTLESYMPKLINAYQTYGKNIDIYVKQLDEKRPKVISINEFKNNDQTVDASLKSITINFDRPLLGKGRSINGIDKSTFPNFKSITYTEDKKSIIIEWDLEGNKNYEFVLTGLAFKSPKGISMNDYKISFKTK
ncbi:DUF4932 domain-containing protein [Pedobacter montanisoli]|uniref:DUF4932 domain-containing protein n=1 Tax=Pedobacter montanisoli TaxID=2923277 RepID=A0ABS9ZV93_9SPHI|nr:DUF4932 domain-containing protein [Pedobacter montanisoli]MCJ0741803.1 DUF4932 domain-containing protein [Pedobacter montanisoli]